MPVLETALTLPTTPGIKRLTWRSRKVAGAIENPFSLQRQVQEWAGERWEVGVTLPPMGRDQAEEWLGVLLALRGISKTFMLRLPVKLQTPRGAAAGAPKLDGAHAAGSKVIATKGWTPNQVNVLKAGDYIQIENYLHKALGADDADVNGKAVFDIFPSTRAAYNDGMAIVAQNPQGIFRLAKNDFSWDISEAMIYGLAFDAVEAI